MRKILFTIIFLAVGCTTASTAHKSDWVVLDQAESVRCSTWPQREKDLQIDDIDFDDVGNAFVVHGTLRNTSKFTYVAPFDGDYEVDVEEARDLPIGRNASVAGVSKVGNANHIVVFEEKSTGTTIEFRNPKTNVVDISFGLKLRDLTPVHVYSTAVGSWIAYKQDDLGTRFIFVDARKGKAAKPAAPKIIVQDQHKIVVDRNNGDLYLLTLNRRDKKKVTLTKLASNGSASENSGIDLKVTYQIESYAVSLRGNELYLAYVDGDSLVGESSLKVAKISLANGSSAVTWTKENSLKNLHVNEPIFAGSKKGEQLLVLKWVDEESTIARYMVTQTGLSKPSYFGVFSRGSRIMRAFSDASGDLFAITRSKGSDRWEFKVCRL